MACSGNLFMSAVTFILQAIAPEQLQQQALGEDCARNRLDMAS